ncbi:MAG: TonB-dependent receptor domain-containing protein [Leptolyngbya sp. IPPAS B-1204]
MGIGSVAEALPVTAQEEEEQSLVIGQSSLKDSQASIPNGQEQITNDQGQMTNAPTLQLSELEQPATTIADWIAQIEASLVQITDVRVEATEAGLQVILETKDGVLDVPETRAIGNALIVDIPNATIAEEFSQANPIEGIALVSVTELPDNRVRVAITGTDAPPVAEVISEAQGLLLLVTLGDADAVAEEDAIQVVVTGEQDEGYNPSSATTATRTDTPLRDIPQSIQVIPQQVIRDRGANSLPEILESVVGVSGSRRSPRTTIISDGILSRGFTADLQRNGIPQSLGADASYTVSDNIERIEILRGPASVLFGLGSPGGTVNVITKRPLREPFYEIEASAGTFDVYRGAVDLSGPLNDSATVLYRLNASANSTGSFIDFFDRETYLLAPSLTWQISEQTTLNLDAEYQSVNGFRFDFGLPAEGTILSNPNGEIPRNRFRGEPSLHNGDIDLYRVGFDLEHRFSGNWQVHSNFQGVFYRDAGADTIPLSFLGNQREQPLFYSESVNFLEGYQLDSYVVGRFSTGSIQHQLVAGFDLYREVLRYTDGVEGSLLPIDVFDPVYGEITLSDLTDRVEFDARFRNQGLGLYLQDQIALTDNLRILLGGRFDIYDQESRFTPFSQRILSKSKRLVHGLGLFTNPLNPFHSMQAIVAHSIQ